jgi:hypothetical protein
MQRPNTPVLPAVLVAAILFGSIATYGIIQSQQREVLGKLFVVQEELSETKEDLLGFTRFTDYMTESKAAISEQMMYLAARVDREYVHVEHIQTSTLGIHSNATILLRYTVEYSFGFDLRPDRFSVSGDKSGITVTLSKPELVASPAVNILSHEVPSTGMFIDEQAAVIALQRQLFSVAKRRAATIKNDEAVVALCEKKLADFLRGFLAAQPNVKVVPVIRFAYK